MKIVHYSSQLEGGAGILMARLHRGLVRRGIESHLRYRRGLAIEADAQRVEFAQGWGARLRERLIWKLDHSAVRPGAPSPFNRSRGVRHTDLLACDRDADIVHLHSVGKWLNISRFIRSVPERAAIVWTIHDMTALAGGCSIDIGCPGIENGCRTCPLLRAPFDKVLARGEWRRRERALRGRKVFVVANSRYTAGLAERACVFPSSRKIATILPGLDPQKFVAHPKSEARRLLGVGADRLVLGFGAAALTDANKGFGRFRAIAERVAQRLGGLEIVLFGDGVSGVSVANARVTSIGRVNAPSLLSLAYSAMDAFLVCSRIETFCQTAIEAQSSGTPVWAFAVGGLADAVADGETGTLQPFGDVDRMAESLVAAYQAGRLPGMGEAGRARAAEHLHIDSKVAQYQRIYSTACPGL